MSYKHARLDEEGQKKTFTLWVNRKLSMLPNKVEITDLYTDFADGVKLARLFEALSAKKMPPSVCIVPDSPRAEFRRLENIGMTLSCIREQGVKLTNLDSQMVMKGDPKMILGLVWTLLHHYDLERAIWAGYQPKREGESTREYLLNWIRMKVPEYRVTNFTSDWRDGRILGGLVDSLAPGACSNWSTWKTANRTDYLDNATRAIDAAAMYLNIPKLLAPEQLIGEDDHSLITYLCQFPQATADPEHLEDLKPLLNRRRVRVLGPGVCSTGNQVGAPAHFTIDTFSAGEGTLEVIAKNPQGEVEKCDVKCEPDNKTYGCKFTPRVKGVHIIEVKYAGQPIPDSPYKVTVEESACDSSKVKVDGAGIEGKDVVTNKPARFFVFCKGAGKGTPDVEVQDPQGRSSVVVPRVDPVDLAQGKYEVLYGPKVAGPHTIFVRFAGHNIPGSPFVVDVEPEKDANQIRKRKTSRVTFCHKITPKHGQVGTENKIIWRIPDTCVKELEVRYTTPTGQRQTCEVTSLGKDMYSFTFVPEETGTHEILITNKGIPVSALSYTVGIIPGGQSNKVHVDRNELMQTDVNKPCEFNVYLHETGGGEMTVEIFGPSDDVQIDVQEREDGSVSVIPTFPQEGDYKCVIKVDGKEIPNSPFLVRVAPADAECHKVTMQPCQQTGIKPGCPTEIRFDRNGAQGIMQAFVVDAVGREIEIPVNDSADHVVVTFTPDASGVYYVKLTCDDYLVQGAPVPVLVGTEECVTETTRITTEKRAPVGTSHCFSTKPCQVGSLNFIIRTIPNTSVPELQGFFTTPDGQQQPCEVTSLGNDMYCFTFVPQETGMHEILITNKGIPVSCGPLPYTVGDIPKGQSHKVYVDPDELRQTEVNEPCEFNVHTHEAGGGELTVELYGPSGDAHVDVKERDDGSVGVIIVFTTPGDYHCVIKLDDEEIPKSPFSVRVAPADAEYRKITMQPVQLTGIKPGCTTEIKFDKHGAEGDIKAFDTDDRGREIEIPVILNDDQVIVKFMPETPGVHRVRLTCNGYLVQGAPVPVLVGTEECVTDTNRLTTVARTSHNLCTKPDQVGTESKIIRKIPNACESDLKGFFTTPTGEQIQCKVTQVGENLYSFSFVPPETGTYVVLLTNKGIPVSGGPLPYTVGDIPKGQSHKVYVDPDELRQTEVNEPCEFNVNAHEAGGGELTIDILGPSEDAWVDVQEREDGSIGVTIVLPQEGNYQCSIRLDGNEIPNSPFKVCVAPPNAEYHKITLPQCQLTGMEPGSPTELKFDRNGAQGTIQAFEVDINGQEEELPVDVQDDQIVVTFRPEGSGIHHVKLLCDGYIVQGAPIRVLAGTEDSMREMSKFKVMWLDDINKTFKPGDEVSFVLGLDKTKDWRVRIETEGPEEPEFSCEGTADGMKGRILIPGVPGVYLISFYVNQAKVGGSPFQLKVEGDGPSAKDMTRREVSENVTRPVASTKCHTVFDSRRLPSTGQVCVTDLSEMGFVGENNVFRVDTEKSGMGLLMVGVEGPTGVAVECTVQFNSEGANKHVVTYKAAEPGRYRIHVQWGTISIPGSPFVVDVQ